MARPKCTCNSSHRELRSLSLYLRIDSSGGGFGFLKRANSQFPRISTVNITTKKANTPKPTSIAVCIMGGSTASYSALIPEGEEEDTSGRRTRATHKMGTPDA